MACLTTIGGMLPAVGIALTLKSIFKGESVVFFFFGFLLVQYFGLDMISLGFSAVVFTLIYMQLKGHKLSAMGAVCLGQREIMRTSMYFWTRRQYANPGFGGLCSIRLTIIMRGCREPVSVTPWCLSSINSTRITKESARN